MSKKNLFAQFYKELVLLASLFIAYLPSFQYEYMFNNDYSLIDHAPDSAFIATHSGGFMQYYMLTLFHDFVNSSHYSYILLRLISFALVYILALIVYKEIVRRTTNELFSITFTIFLFATPIFSTLMLWENMTATIPGFYLSYIAFLLVYEYTLKAKYDAYLLTFSVVILASVISAVGQTFYQTCIGLPLAFLTLAVISQYAKSTTPDSSLKSTSSTSDNQYKVTVSYSTLTHESVVYTRKYNSNDYYPLNRYTKFLHQLKINKHNIYTMIMVALSQVIYSVIEKTDFFMSTGSHNNGGATSIASEEGEAILSVIWRLITSFTHIINGNYSMHYYYFGFFSKEISIIIGIFIAYVVVKAMYKNIKTANTLYDRHNSIVKWFILVSCFFLGSVSFILDSSRELHYKYFQTMLILIVFVHAYSILYTPKVKFEKWSNELKHYVSLQNTRYNVAQYIFAVALVVLSVIASNVYNLRGLVYTQSVELLYVKSELLNQLNSKAYAKEPFVKEIMIIQPEKSCYFLPCYGHSEYEEKLSSHEDFAVNGLVKYALFGVLNKEQINDIKITHTDKYDNLGVASSDVIIINVEALHKALLGTYGEFVDTEQTIVKGIQEDIVQKNINK